MGYGQALGTVEVRLLSSFVVCYLTHQLSRMWGPKDIP